MAHKKERRKHTMTIGEFIEFAKKLFEMFVELYNKYFAASEDESAEA